MTLEALLEKFGYLAVFIGTFLEGETTLVIASFLAEQDLLQIHLVVFTAFLGSLAVQTFAFWLGRTQGIKIVNRYPKMQKHLGRGVRLFERYGIPAIFMSQYIYGLRMTCSIVVGISRIPKAKFLAYQALSSLAWACLVGSLGFYFGKIVKTFLGRAVHMQKYVLLGVVVIAGGIYIYRKVKERREALLADTTGIS